MKPRAALTSSLLRFFLPPLFALAGGWISTILVWRGSAQELSPSPRESLVNFSFDQVDIPTFVRLVGEWTGRRFIVGEGVQGRLTVVSPQVKRSEILPLVAAILESAGCSLVQEGDLYRVVPAPARQTPLAPVVGPGQPLPDHGLVTRIFRVEYVAAAELRKVLETRVLGGKTGAVVALEETNHLIVTDTVGGIRRIEQLLSEVDRPGLTRTTEVVPLEYADPEALAEQLNLALMERASRGQQIVQRLTGPGTAPSGVAAASALVIPAPHANSLLLVGTASQIAALKELIRQMDRDVPTGRSRLNAIFLRYLSATEAAKSLSTLIEKGRTKEGTPPAARRTFAIEADPINNALLVDASPSDFDVVRKLVEQLDRVPQQVHITVVIAEVSSVTNLNLGVEMAALNMPSGPGDTVIQGSSTLKDSAAGLVNAVQQGLLPGGLSIGVARGTRLDADGRVLSSWPGLINIEAVRKDSRFRILSETSLQAQNNREASINIVNDIPILKSTIQAGTGTARDVIQNIERMDVGIKLKLTPRIIPGGEVQMDLDPSIEAVLETGSENQLTPTIARRSVHTTVTVADGQTIVIAGLTRQDTRRTDKRVPLLGDIPLLGRLFRYRAEEAARVDLLIFVTPRIVDHALAAEAVRAEWEGKTGLQP